MAGAVTYPGCESANGAIADITVPRQQERCLTAYMLWTSESLEVSARTFSYILFRTTCKPLQQDGHPAGVKTFSWLYKETRWLHGNFGEGQICTKAGCPTAHSLSISSRLASLGRKHFGLTSFLLCS